MRLLCVLVGFVVVAVTTAVDTLQDGDDLGSGYNGDHSIDPDFVTSDRFGVKWTFKPDFAGQTERFAAKPLVYTGPDGRQVLIAAASSNNIYVLDAKTGEVLTSRQIRKPYTEPALPCGDLVPHNGVLGTPVIDPATGTLYVFAKGYKEDGSAGPFNSVFWAHAVDALTLEEREGFPVIVDGPASNDPTRYFIGGLHLQRPSLKLLNGHVYAAFGGGCGSFNQTGWLASVNAQSGKVAQLWATQAGPQAPSTEGGFFVGGGGGSIWQSGTGLSTDRNDRLFLTIGDGQVFDNTFPAAAGNNPGDILEGTVINLKLNTEDGTFEPQDHFRLAGYNDLGTSGRDMGSGGLTILDPEYFSVPGADRLAIAGGQSGHVTLLNLDDLGGYRQGPNGTDKIIQTWPIPGAVSGLVYGNFATYPLEGGYVYIKPVGLRSVFVYKFGEGPDYFKLVAQTEEPGVTAVGSGSPVVTTNNGKPGTAILWLADINQGLTAYHAVPRNGTLVRIPVPHVGRPKFQRPVFNDNIVYVVTTDGYVVAYGEKDN
ncbi:hypothetical protein FA15DRAFT_392696 [Coprinopsis marcescibilis]|uniref:Pyrrolo-quinoline quinone n=1 Tax=Coprinopsis marcescibilis TaxID=230819 RepID=A0A5C3L994_COPMA|nr:hypothetical protein FA15DRAFT_392696 [Coprinopsis marcescibilis]